MDKLNNISRKPVDPEPGLLWFSGICDRILAKIQWWFDNYEKGRISRTRKFFHPRGEVVDIPMQYLHEIPFTTAELKHLIRIMSMLRPKQTGLLEILRIAQRDLKLRRMTPQGEYLSPMPFFKSDVKTMLDALLDAKAGIKSSEDDLYQKAKEGKFLWG